jgi:hypothetical protein
LHAAATAERADLPDGLVAGTRDGMTGPVGQEHLAHGQFVAGEGARLVARDQRATAEPLDCREASNDRTAPGHAPGGDRKGDRDRNWQAFRNRRHGQRHSEHEHGSDACVVQEHADGPDDDCG